MKVFKINDKVISRINSAGNKVALAPQPEPEKPYILVTLSDPGDITDTMYGNGHGSTPGTDAFIKERVSNYTWKFKWNKPIESLTSLDNLFYSMTNTRLRVLSVDMSNIDTSHVISTYAMFRNCITLRSLSYFDTSNVTTMGSMFNGCITLTSVPLLDTSNAESMSSMFSGCTNLTSVPLLNTSNVTNMDSMFYNCSNLASVPLFSTSKCEFFEFIFLGCDKLSTIPALDFSGDTSWSVAKLFGNNVTSINVTHISRSFDITNCTKLTSTALYTIISNLSRVTSTVNIISVTTKQYNSISSYYRRVATEKGWEFWVE